RPIYNKMFKMGKDVVSLFNQPVNKLLSQTKIVSGTAPDIPPSKRKNTIYHFHSIINNSKYVRQKSVLED
ncbi:unnamed protein product, partial [marine sediment metagenome]